jgi:D-sedoheptulose 7-phosphate isomerase
MSLDHLNALAALAGRCAADLGPDVERYVALVRRTLAGGGTLFFAGNGGSAAHAQHIATEYVVRYGPVSRRAARAIALSTDSSLITAASNDLGFETVFARQIEAHGRRGDLLVLISTSGDSANCLRAAEAARALEVTTVGLLGHDGGRLKGLVDVAIVVPTEDTALAQEIQLAIDHHVCSVIEGELSKTD